MKRPIALATLAAIVLFASCKKEDGGTNNNPTLVGNYKLKYVTSNQNSTIEASDGEKEVMVTDFTTINNQGSLAFTNSSMTGTGIGYDVDANGKYYEYDGADLIDTFSVPLVWSLPPTNLTAPYQLIGSDSIYFPQGSFTPGVGGTNTQQGAPGGGRYSVSGNLLTITQHYNMDSTFNDSGISIQVKNQAVSSIVLEKQ